MSNTTAIKVSTTTNPDDFRYDDESASRPLPPGVLRVTDNGGGTFFHQTVPADIIDKTRREARQATYRNSEEEAAVIRATDDAVYDRVRPMERYMMDRAESFLTRNKARVGESLSYVDEIEALKTRLRNGEDTTAVAKDYKALESRIRSRELRVLRSLAGEADSIGAALADPVAHVQRLLHHMPRDRWQPLDLRKYLA